MQRDSRTVRIVDEPLEGQAAGANGEYLVAEVSHRLRKGYVLDVRHLRREKRDGLTSESFMLISSGRSVLVHQDSGPFKRSTLKSLTTVGGTLYEAFVRSQLEVLRPEVLGLWEAEKASREARIDA